MKEIELKLGDETVTLDIEQPYVEMFNSMEEVSEEEMDLEEIAAVFLRENKDELERWVENGLHINNQNLKRQR